MKRKGLITLSRPFSEKSESDVPKRKSKQIGFKGGLEKLQNRRNDIAVSEKGTEKVKKNSQIGTSKKKTPMVGGVKSKQVILRDPTPVEQVESVAEEESSELISDSENEDMVKFCKRMCKKTIDAINENLTVEEINKKKELRKFQKVRDKFIQTLTSNFKEKVKANIKAGKFILHQYDTKEIYENYSVQDLLLKQDDPANPLSPDNQSGLLLISKLIDPFRAVHYTYREDAAKTKEYRIIEVTWAVASKKNTKLPPNKLPEKYNKRWKIAPVTLIKEDET